MAYLFLLFPVNFHLLLSHKLLFRRIRNLKRLFLSGCYYTRCRCGLGVWFMRGCHFTRNFVLCDHPHQLLPFSCQSSVRLETTDLILLLLLLLRSCWRFLLSWENIWGSLTRLNWIRLSRLNRSASNILFVDRATFLKTVLPLIGSLINRSLTLLCLNCSNLIIFLLWGFCHLFKLFINPLNDFHCMGHLYFQLSCAFLLQLLSVAWTRPFGSWLLLRLLCCSSNVFINELFHFNWIIRLLILCALRPSVHWGIWR